MKDFAITLTFVQTNGFVTGWIKEISGVVSQAPTVEQAQKELIEALKIKFDVEKRLAENRISHDSINAKNKNITEKRFILQPC